MESLHAFWLIKSGRMTGIPLILPLKEMVSKERLGAMGN